ncbi:hypothetical protein AAF712_010455 [Marasmius tenuissimus]|uniref:Uncharacterized protein n=1 Tax=Marasmius tenuissimus TaxID=585030 RepID=A0ABR2ZLY3_9AGAR
MLYSLLSTTFVLSLSLCANAKTVTSYIDDSLGDSATGVKPIYFPQGEKIWQDQSCGRAQGCRIVPDTEKTHNKTYTAATYKTSMDNMGFNLSFQGTSIAIYFILANDDFDGPTTTRTECNFILDGSVRKSYTHLPVRGKGIEYDVEVYKEDGLAGDQMHTLEVSTGKKKREVFLAFDYAVYTVEEPDDQNATTSSGSAQTTTSSGAPAQNMNTQAPPNNVPQTAATTGTSNGASETSKSSNENSNENSSSNLASPRAVLALLFATAVLGLF